jgi:hypothetical protein
LHALTQEVALKAYEHSLGKYLERVANGVHNDIGDPKHVFKLNEPGFFESNFKTPDGEKLKLGVEKLIGKMEIISRHALSQKRFKKAAN